MLTNVFIVEVYPPDLILGECGNIKIDPNQDNPYSDLEDLEQDQGEEIFVILKHEEKKPFAINESNIN